MMFSQHFPNSSSIKASVNFLLTMPEHVWKLTFFFYLLTILIHSIIFYQSQHFFQGRSSELDSHLYPTAAWLELLQSVPLMTVHDRKCIDSKYIPFSVCFQHACFISAGVHAQDCISAGLPFGGRWQNLTKDQHDVLIILWKWPLSPIERESIMPHLTWPCRKASLRKLHRKCSSRN